MKQRKKIIGVDDPAAKSSQQPSINNTNSPQLSFSQHQNSVLIFYITASVSVFLFPITCLVGEILLPMKINQLHKQQQEQQPISTANSNDLSKNVVDESPISSKIIQFSAFRAGALFGGGFGVVISFLALGIYVTVISPAGKANPVILKILAWTNVALMVFVGFYLMMRTGYSKVPKMVFVSGDDELLLLENDQESDEVTASSSSTVTIAVMSSLMILLIGGAIALSVVTSVLQTSLK